VLEHAPVLLGHAHHPGDDRGRQRVGQASQEVVTAGRDEVVEQLVHELPDPPAHRAHLLLAERPAGQPVQPGVHGRVGDHHPAADDRQHRPVLGPALRGQDVEQRPDPVRGQPRVAEGGHHVVVAGQQPGLAGRRPVHRVARAQLGVVGKGVLGEFR
jgi:hypothetical protein